MPFEIQVKKHAFKDVTFYIDENIFKFDKKEILINDISGFGYMSTLTKINGIKASKEFDIAIWQNEVNTPTIFRFMGSFGGGAANEKYSSITDQLWNYFGDKMLNQMHLDLMNGKTIELTARVKLISKGIIVRRKPLFGQAYEALGTWDSLTTDTYQSTVTFKSSTNKKARTTENFIGKNIWLVYFYFQWLSKNPEILGALQEIPNNYQLIEKRK
jgi:hypothetical protein